MHKIEDDFKLTNNLYYKLYYEFLDKIPEDRVFNDELNRLAYGTDASFYRLIPKIVVKVVNSDEIQFILSICSEKHIPVTFRAAGTSLSGQSISDSVLIVIDRSWRGHSISDDQSYISLEPSVIGSFANVYLKPFNKKIGPDPASINAAMIGGIAANNASGMCCGTAQNSYNTLKSMKIIFADGSFLDTADEESVSAFKESHKALISEIAKLHDEINSDQELSDLIRKKYKMKNTTGYSLNSLVDFSDPIEIIQHLMIGSEGTLGFIAEVTYITIDELQNKASALILFQNIEDACKAVFTLKKQPVDAVEIMDRASLRSVENKSGMPDYLKTLSESVTALLIETSAKEKEGLQDNIEMISSSLDNYNLVLPIEFTDDPSKYSKLWNIRKGLFPSVGAMRKTGTTCIIEDVAFPLDKLADAAIELQALFSKYRYKEAIIFGHSLEGNLHFVFNQDFSEKKEVQRYKNFMDEVIKMTSGKYKGSLKAEHGTGRNMAPFVKYEWGEKAYSIMEKIKIVFDPDQILNPGVILNSDQNIHIKNLKPLPASREIVDKCIECGFCENDCPSRDLTLTPRQRITVFREICRLKALNHEPLRRNELIDSFNYYGEETCATDGLCSIACPVDIDTGKLIKELRTEEISKTAMAIANILANRMSVLSSIMRHSLNLLYHGHRLVGSNIFKNTAKLKKSFFGKHLPYVDRWIPKGADKLIQKSQIKSKIPKVVYFPSCISRTMGNPKDSINQDSLTTVTQRLLTKAGYEIIYPNNMENLCCGMPWLSKGFKETGNMKSNELIDELISASENGKYPVLFDTSPCVQTTKNHLQSLNESSLKIYEPVEFICDYLINELEISQQEKTIAVHVTCSSTKMGLRDKFIQAAETCATNIVIPENVSCCGFAGDRGFNFPELNESALRDLKEQIPSDCNEGYSNSKTCEIGLSTNSGIEYRSILYLFDEATN